MPIKDILLVGACIFSFLAANSQETKKCLVLLKNDASTVYLPLESDPKITFHEGDNWRIYENMTIDCGDDQLTVWLPEQDKLQIMEVSGVDLIADDENSEMNIIGKEIIVNTALPNTSYSIANLKGQSVAAGELTVGLSKISLSSYQSDIYIITIGNKSFKIRIK